MKLPRWAQARRVDGAAARNLADMLALATGRFHRSQLGMIGKIGGAGGLAPSAGALKAIPKAGHLTIPVPYSSAKGAVGGLIYETTARATSATAITPTQQGEYLVGMWLEGGGAGGAGSWQFLYDAVHSAHFPVGAAGLDATGAIGPENAAFYPVNYGPIGQNIPTTGQTYFGGLAATRFLLSNRPNPGAPTMDEFTAVAVTGNESGTGGTSKTYSIPGPLGKPVSILALASIQAGNATGIPVGEIDFPAVGNYGAYNVPAVLARGQEPTGAGSGYAFFPVPDYDPAASFALTHKCNTLGAATDLQIAGFLRYRWS